MARTACTYSHVSTNEVLNRTAGPITISVTARVIYQLLTAGWQAGGVTEDRDPWSSKCHEKYQWVYTCTP